MHCEQENVKPEFAALVVLLSAIRVHLARPLRRERALRMFCNGMMARVLLMPIHRWFVCTSISDDDIEVPVTAARDVFAGIGRAI